MPEGYEDTPEPGVISFDDNGYYMEEVDPDEGDIPVPVLPSHEIPPLQYAGDSEGRVQGVSLVGSQTQDRRRCW